jgi:hypothetical protein
MCGHNRQIQVNCHSSDCNSVTLTKDDKVVKEITGYLPNMGMMGGGDDLSFTFCADCGQIQDFRPVKLNYVPERRTLDYIENINNLVNTSIYTKYGPAILLNYQQAEYPQRELVEVLLQWTNQKAIYYRRDFNEIFLDPELEEVVF